MVGLRYRRRFVVRSLLDLPIPLITGTFISMLIVGIETSGLVGSVALTRNGQCLEVRSLEQAGRRHAQGLALELRELLKRHDVTAKNVDAVAVSRGPGSFTGLRVGMVCAKTFAYATRCQFVAVDTFTAVAMNCPAEISDLWVVEDAQRGELFAGRYQVACGTWIRPDPIDVVDAETWLKSRSAHEVLAGRGLTRCDLSLTTATCLTEDRFIQPLASSVALQGERMLLDPKSYPSIDFDCWIAVPFYIRRSAAEEQRDKRDAATEIPSS
jgi:tRNA threonylcarbamoyladenosine biosynthesis protein TsaB